MLPALLLPVPAAAAAPAPAEGARTLCSIRDPRIPESSGLAASADALWTVNDGGSRLRVFQLDRSCRVRRTIEAGLDPYDVEDLARAADGTLWLADTGDNGFNRKTVAVERLRPDGTAELFRLTYPDGPHDAEALLLDSSGRLYIATKEPLTSTVYTPDRQLSASRPTPLRQVAAVALAPTGTAGGPGTAGQVLVTGGAVSADGRQVVLRTYTDAYVWSAPERDVEAALRSGDRRRIPLPATAQGEAVAFSADGRALLTSTEGLPGAVHEVSLGETSAPARKPAGTPPAAGVEDSSSPAGDLVRTLLLPIGAVVLVGGLVSWLLVGRH